MYNTTVYTIKSIVVNHVQKLHNRTEVEELQDVTEGSFMTCFCVVPIVIFVVKMITFFVFQIYVLNLNAQGIPFGG